MKRAYVGVAVLFIATSLTVFAQQVVVTEIEDNKGGVYQAVELEEGGEILPRSRLYDYAYPERIFSDSHKFPRQRTARVDKTIS